jgi:hypothetical protein
MVLSILRVYSADDKVINECRAVAGMAIEEGN